MSTNLTPKELIDFLLYKKGEFSYSCKWLIRVDENISKEQWEKIDKIKELQYTGRDSCIKGQGVESHFFKVEYDGNIIENISENICKSLTKNYFKKISKQLTKIIKEITCSKVPIVKVEFYSDEKFTFSS